MRASTVILIVALISIGLSGFLLVYQHMDARVWGRGFSTGLAVAFVIWFFAARRAGDI